jgi:hypothetical protein
MRTRSRTAARLSALLLTAVAAACGSSKSGGGSPATACFGGDYRSCMGPGNCRGEQSCEDNGSGWSACTCTDAGTSGTGGGGRDASADSASGGFGGTGGFGTGGFGTGGFGTGGFGAGGSTGTGGFGTGGSTGTAGSALLFQFTSSTQGFAYYPGGVGTAGVLSDKTGLMSDPSVGNPLPGSLVFAIPFNAYGQSAVFYAPLTSTMNLSGKTLYAKVKLDAGFSPNAAAPGGVVLIALSSPQYLGESFWQNVLPASMGTWAEYAFPLSGPDWTHSDSGYDPSQLVAVGIGFFTGNGPGALPTMTAFHVDTIEYR